MACDWRWLAVAGVAAAMLAWAGGVDAQPTAKKGAAKAAAPQPAAEGEEAGKSAGKRKKQDPAEAQRTIDTAAKLLEAGKADAAAQALTGVVTGGNLPPAIMAKALYYRGIAYRQQRKPALAIADLTSALWLKGGLSSGDRAEALKQRASAYREAGLTESGEVVAAAVPSAPAPPASPAAAPRSTTRTASIGQTWSTATSPEPGSASLAPAEAPAQPPQSGGLWSFPNPFAGWFGGATPASPRPQTAAAPAPQATASIPPGEPAATRAKAASAWSSATQVHGAAEPASAPAKAAPARPEGRFRIQVGMVRTQAEAAALAAKVRSEHAAALADRAPEVDQTVVGNMGSFYRVRFGPYASPAEGQAACARLKGSGLDCLVVSQ